jgi:hypothetical protein
MILGGPGCKLVRSEAAKARMRPVTVVVDPPSLDDLAGGVQAAERVLVEASVAEATVEALHEAILHRFTWSDVVPFHGVILLPLQDRSGGQLLPLSLTITEPVRARSRAHRTHERREHPVAMCPQQAPGILVRSRRSTTRTRNRRAETKSRLQRWFRSAGRRTEPQRSKKSRA